MQLEHNWEVLKALSNGNKAAEASVLVELMRDKPIMTDLNTIWRELGVSLKGNNISYDDTAKTADL